MTEPVSDVSDVTVEVPEPTVVPSVSGTETVAVEAQEGELALTGAKVGMLSALAAAFVAAGIVAFRISRRAHNAK